MKLVIALSALVLAITIASPASAECSCVCTPQGVQAMCQSAIEIRPICAPQICPIATPSIAPIMTPVVPPVGTQQCYAQQVLNPYTHQYEWQRVCQ